MAKKKALPKRITKRVKMFLLLDPVRTVEGTITIPGRNSRLSDVVNDDRPFLSLQDVVVTDGWLSPPTGFMLLNKKEVRAMVEVN